MPSRPWIDASLTIDGGSVAWSGLARPELAWEAAIAGGAAVNAGRLALSLHTGTHADAPRHVDDAGRDAAGLDLEAYVGPARLVRVPDGPVTRAVLEARGIGAGVPTLERLLVASATPYDGRRFPDRVAGIAPEAAAWLASLGLRLVGVDVPSVDPLDSKALPAHHALLGAGVAILENLRLEGLDEGEYDLVAVPLRIAGGDASPVRAIVRRRD